MMLRLSATALPLSLTLLAALVPPAHAQFKVVAPDGSVTYTDRPAAQANARVTSIGRNGAVQAVDVALPADLRQVAQRYPVTLYTGNDCAPCESGRKLLTLRGIPYAERRVASEDDAAVLEKVAGARTVPALTIGTQALRGFSETDWTAYLDAAGYPRESRLPRGWQAPALQAANDRATAVKPSASSPRADPATPAPVPEPPPAGSLRF